MFFVPLSLKPHFGLYDDINRTVLQGLQSRLAAGFVRVEHITTGMGCCDMIF